LPSFTSYFSNARSVSSTACRAILSQILEIGCGTVRPHWLSEALRALRRWELFENAAEEARDVLSEVIVGNVETLSLLATRNLRCAHSFRSTEHLVEPGEVPKRLSRCPPGGMLLASSPNISHWRDPQLVPGRFQLADQGVFDHASALVYADTFADLADKAGFDVEELGPVTAFSTRTELISKLSAGRLDHLFMTQIAMIARKR
jgi:hypothetical protein